MDEKTLDERLCQLAEILTPLPQTDATRSSKGAYAPSVPPPSARTTEKMLDYVRLHAKYLVFDLEATRRESRYLRQMLERRTNLGDGPDSP